MKKLITAMVLLSPTLAFAATEISTILGTVQSIINTAIPIVIGIALVLFLYGIITYITSGGNEDKQKEARNYIIYGLIGLFVMVAVWGLVNVISDTFDINPASAPNAPGIPGGNNTGYGGNNKTGGRSIPIHPD